MFYNRMPFEELIELAQILRIKSHESANIPRRIWNHLLSNGMPRSNCASIFEHIGFSGDLKKMPPLSGRWRGVCVFVNQRNVLHWYGPGFRTQPDQIRQ